MARLKRKLRPKTHRTLKRRIQFDYDKTSYGGECERPDMLHEDYEMAKDEFLKNLQEQVNIYTILS